MVITALDGAENQPLLVIGFLQATSFRFNTRCESIKGLRIGAA